MDEALISHSELSGIDAGLLSCDKFRLMDCRLTQACSWGTGHYQLLTCSDSAFEKNCSLSCSEIKELILSGCQFEGQLDCLAVTVEDIFSFNSLHLSVDPVLLDLRLSHRG